MTEAREVVLGSQVPAPRIRIPARVRERSHVLAILAVFARRVEGTRRQHRWL